MIVLVMGVAGSGKSAIGRALAKRLDAAFLDADDFHSAESVAKMERGEPLSDRDRMPWLDAIAAAARGVRRDVGGPVVIACSALRRNYRARLIRRIGPVRLVYLKGSRPLVAKRLKNRRGHFFPVTLVDSQFATLEEPGRAIVIDAATPVAEAVAHIARRLGPARSKAKKA